MNTVDPHCVTRGSLRFKTWLWRSLPRQCYKPKSKTPEENPRRFDVSVFDALLERLPS